MNATRPTEHWADETTASSGTNSPAELYLELLKNVLLRLNPPERYKEPPKSVLKPNSLAALIYPTIQASLRRFNLALCSTNINRDLRRFGEDWPSEAETMIGSARLDNLHDCVRTVLEQGVPGDFIETGVWRGGACIFMRAALNAYGDRERNVWVADSFEGLPRPDQQYPVDIESHNDFYRCNDVLGISLEQVKSNFKRYGVLDSRVKFLKGWFRDTLPNAPVHHLAILRLDGDMYGSTIEALENLFPKLSRGGFVIVDDYLLVPECKAAVTDYRAKHGVTDTIINIDHTGVFWRKR